jgi:peptide/nickel transport system substrate-binding protein
MALAQEEPQASPQVLNFGVYFEPSSLDPHAINEWAGMWMTNNVYDTLVRYRAVEQDGELVGTTEVEPSLAESYEVSDDGRTYTFKIREGVTFHNGAELTAEDVVFSLRRVLRLGLAPAQQLAACVEEAGIQETGAFEVTVELSSTCPYFLTMLAQTNVGSIMSRDYVEENGGVQPGQPNEHLRTNTNGTGPFLFGSWEPGVQYELVANEAYWDGPPRLERVVFRFIDDLANQYLLLQQGRLDVVYNLPSDLLQQALTNEQLVVNQQAAVGTQFLYMNNQTEPFDDVRVRQAVMYALDTAQIAEAVTFGIAQPARSAFPAALPGYNGELWPYEHDPERARELLAEAGYENGFQTTITYNPHSASAG